MNRSHLEIHFHSYRMEVALLYFQTIYMIQLLLWGSLGSNDPCDALNHQVFNDKNFGSRNEICDSNGQGCDYYLTNDWYVTNSSTLLNRCPVTGNCGVAYPAWMNGCFPRIEDGIVDRLVCIKMSGNCCKKKVTIRIKNCTSFFVYYLQPLPACPMAFCFESNMSCGQQTSKSGTTRNTSASHGTGTLCTLDNAHNSTTEAEETYSDGNVTPEVTKHCNVLLIAICVGVSCFVLTVLLIILTVVCKLVRQNERGHVNRRRSIVEMSPTTVSAKVTEEHDYELPRCAYLGD